MSYYNENVMKLIDNIGPAQLTALDGSAIAAV